MNLFADMNTTIQEDMAAELYLKKRSMPQTVDDCEKGRKLYISLFLKKRKNNVVLSAIARISSSIMKTDVFIREPHVITMMMILFNINPMFIKAKVIITFSSNTGEVAFSARTMWFVIFGEKEMLS